MLSFILQIISTTAILSSIECLTEPQRPPLSYNITIKDKHIVVDEYKNLSTLRYTKHSVSNISGDHCITDCVNNYCLTEKERVETCQVDERRKFESPIIYYTSYKLGVHICLSKCTKGVKNYYWCYIGNEYETDYCNPSTDYKLIASIFEEGTDVFTDPCRDKCEKRDNERHEWCNLRRKLKAETARCHANELIYYQYHKESTQLKQECAGACGQWPLKKDEEFYWCSMDDFNGEKWDYCAQTAEEFSFCKQCGKVDLQRYIKKVERDSNNIRVLVNDSSTSIISYTYKMLPDGVRLPLVVRAIIWRTHIRDKEVIRNIVDENTKINCIELEKNVSDCRSYVFGNLVAFKHGGTGDFYNVVPLSKHLNFGKQNGDFITPSVWIVNEQKITNYAYDFNGVIELNIGVYYNDKSRMPTAIGRSMRVLDRDVTSSLWQCENFYSNDPKSSQECIENEDSEEEPIDDIDIRKTK